jgi:hypothetical protein
MSSNVINQVSFLRTTREFPEEIHQLCVEASKAYIDTANAVNVRIIGLFSTNQPSITGESWFLNNRKQQTLRQVFTFTTTAAINHNINNGNGISTFNFTRCWGSYVDTVNGDANGLIWGTRAGGIPNNISFYVTSTQIVFVVGAGAPALSSGRIILEWLSAV